MTQATHKMCGDNVLTNTLGILFTDGTEQLTAATPIDVTPNYIIYADTANSVASTGLLYDGVSEFFETNIGSIPTSITFGGILGNTIAVFMAGDVIPGSGKTGAGAYCTGMASGVGAQRTDGSSITLSCDDTDPRTPLLELKMTGIGVATSLMMGNLVLAGTTSGSSTIQVAAAAGNPSPLQLPLSNASAGQFLTSDGGSPQQLSWATQHNPVVNTQKFGSLNAAKGTTALYTVGAAGQGFYRVTWCATIITPDNVSSVLGGTHGFELAYSNANGDILGKLDNFGTPVVTSNNTTGTSISGVTMGYVGNSSVINFTYDYTSNTPGQMFYALSVVTEFLGG